MEFKDKQSIYLQIADYICEQILLENWPVNERIPSVRDLAVLMEVNPNTVMRTYDFLQGKNIIFNRRGIGYFADEKAVDHIKAYRKERFLVTELPVFFKTIYLLDMNFEELKERYEDFVKENFAQHTSNK
ncbi:GntR family transcriptional regulator [soil metagenome]